MKTRDIVIGLIIAAIVILYLIQKEQKQIAPTKPIVNLYLNVDRTCADPILDRFEKESNITVRRHYSFNGGLLRRLMRNQRDPKADLYWSEDPIEVMLLKEQNLTSSYRSPFAEALPARFKDRDAHWTAIAGRLRLLLVHRGVQRVPVGIEDFVNPVFKGDGITATPLHGSQRIYIAALLRRWGVDRTEAFLRKIRDNAALASDDHKSGDLVAQGRYDFTLIDSDDALIRIRNKEPVVTIFPDQRPKGPGTLVIPGLLTLLRGAPHPKMAKKLFDYLLRSDTAKELALQCRKIPLQKDVKLSQPLLSASGIKMIGIDYNNIAQQLPILRSLLQTWSIKR